VFFSGTHSICFRTAVMTFSRMTGSVTISHQNRHYHFFANHRWISTQKVLK